MSRHQRKAAAAKKDGPRASRKPQKARRRSRRPQEATAPEAAAQPNPSTVVAVNPEDLKGTRKIIGGSWSDNWNNIIVNQAVNTLWLKHLSLEERDKQFSATIAALAGIGPKDELEGMLAAQLIATHNASMECYRRAMLPDQTFQGRQEALSQASKLSRTYATLLEALNRHRGKGQQKVTVEHVHVHSGGQAIVGKVEAGGRVMPKSEDQAHALAYAPGQTLPSEDEARDRVSVTRDAERPLPHARRNVAGSTKGQ